MSRRSAPWLPVLLLVAATPVQAIVVQPFTPSGTYQRSGSPGFTIGAGGAVEEIDGFLTLGGGPATQLSTGAALPTGLSLAFSSTLSNDGTDLLLRYDVTNTGPGTASDVGFLSFLDAEIDEPLNTFWNEYGETEGTVAPGQGFEIDEPGFVFGDIVANALAGQLDGTNAVPIGAPEDVSLALSFVLASLASGETARFELLISEDGDALGGFLLRQRDADTSATAITLSGAASVVPEPATALLVGVGLVGLARARLRRAVAVTV